MTGEPINVLMIDDDPTDFRIIARHLETVRAPGYKVTPAADFEAARRALAEREFDVALVDYRMPGGASGLDFVNSMGGREADLPFIILTGMADGDLDRQALLAGAYDYIDKMALTRELVDRAIRFAVSSFRYERDLRAAVTTAQEQATINRRILSIVSHEMRSPLRSITGYAEHLIEHSANAPARDAARKMRAASLVLEDFLNNLSEFVRLDEGAARLSPEAFALDQMIEETVDLFLPYAHHKSIAIDTAMDASARTTVTADRLRLRQVLINIVKNAVNYSDGGAISVKARIEAGIAEIKVSDSGLGIAPEKLAALMSSDAWAPHPSRSLDGGLGIGLSICRRLLRLMSGSLRLESAEGFGTTVTITIPVVSELPS